MMSSLLHLTNVSRNFGGLRAVDDVSLKISEGEIIGLIGPNGAGKSTLINVVSGVNPATTGVVEFLGKDITRERSHKIAGLGIARTFQVVQPFPNMTVRENIAAGATFAGQILSLKEALDHAGEIARNVGLENNIDQVAGTLTLARRKRLELAKSLAMKPKLLFLDEVNAGLNANEIEEALVLIREIAAKGVTIVLVEHLMKVVLGISQRIIVLQNGAVIADDLPESIIENQAVAEAYLGRKYAAKLARGEV